MPSTAAAAAANTAAKTAAAATEAAAASLQHWIPHGPSQLRLASPKALGATMTAEPSRCCLHDPPCPRRAPAPEDLDVDGAGAQWYDASLTDLLYIEFWVCGSDASPKSLPRDWSRWDSYWAKDWQHCAALLEPVETLAGIWRESRVFIQRRVRGADGRFHPASGF